jgi:sec-independent protein translocase protein TatB
MPGFQDSAVIVILALLLFGPKKLPVLARQLGKLMGDFRRASNEFRTQMEEELRISEQAERQKQVAAIEASAPSTIAEPEQALLPAPTDIDSHSLDSHHIDPLAGTAEVAYETAYDSTPEATHESEPIAIAVSGDLSILPPSTGLPIAASAPFAEPHTPPHEAELETETMHG